MNSLHILHVLEAAGGGSGRVVLDLIQGQKARGHTVSLVYSPLRTTPDVVRDVHALTGVRVLPLPMRRAVGLWDAPIVMRLAWIFMRLRPDVVHAHSSKAGACARLARWGRWSSARQVYTPHAFVTLDPEASPLYRVIERALALLSDAIIAVSEAEAQHAREVLGISPRKIHVVANAITPPKFDPLGEDGRLAARQALGIDEDTPSPTVIGFVGRMTAQKRPLRALEAFRAVARTHPELHMVMLGSGDLVPEVLGAIRRYDLENRVRLYEDRQARAVMPAFDLLLASSDFEGFPVVFLEALAAGVPIVTTPVGGALETVTPQTGRIASGVTDQALTHALADILSLPEDARLAMRVAARDHAATFTHERMLDATEVVYHRG